MDKSSSSASDPLCVALITLYQFFSLVLRRNHGGVLPSLTVFKEIKGSVCPKGPRTHPAPSCVRQEGVGCRPCLGLAHCLEWFSPGPRPDPGSRGRPCPCRELRLGLREAGKSPSSVALSAESELVRLQQLECSFF